MKKIFTTIAILLTLCITLTAAPAVSTVSGRIADSADSTAISGAVIELSPVKGNGPKKYTSSGAGGAFTLPSVEYGEYNMKVSFLGFKNTELKITVKSATTNVGRLMLTQETMLIDDVVLKIQAMRTSQKGDTISYNADAFKVAKDADAEGLLSKLPGVRIVDGAVEAQGETVKKIFVDGKEFFGQDVNTAIKNIPAETISKIEVYNKQSDQSEFTGVDDGEGYKAINIVTKSEMRQGQFGKLYAGYGFDDKYIIGGSVNIFSGDSKISLIGLANNLNQQNFSSEDILGISGSSSSGGGRGGGGWSRGGGGGFSVPQQSGISTVNSFGVNYSDQWGKKLSITGSYFFNMSDNENLNETTREYYSTSEIRRLYSSNTSSDATNYNHRFNARIDYKINEFQSLMFRPSISFQSNDSSSEYLQANGNGVFRENQVTAMSDTLNTINGKSSTESNGYNISNSIIYRARLGKAGRTITLDGSLNLSNRESNGYSYSLTHYYPTITQPDRPDSLVNRQNISDVNSYSIRANAIYTEPLTEHAQINLQYRFNYNDQPSNRKTYLLDEYYNPISNNPDPKFSNIFASNYMTQSFGPGYNYGTKKTVAVASVSYQTSTLDGDRTFPLPEAQVSANFKNVVYFGMLNQTFSPNNTLRVTLRSSTSNPSVTDLQDVVDVSNSQSVSSGNPHLKPSYEHNIYANYNRSNVTKGRTFMFMIGGAIRDNYIADSLVQLRGNETYLLPNGDLLENGAQYTHPVNLSGYRNMRSMVNFGFPVSWIKSNLNLTAGLDYSRAPSVINGNTNISSTFNYNGGIVVSSNISENLDFTLRYNAGYNVAKNTINTTDDNIYLNQSASGNLKWVMWGGFTFAANASYTRYSGISDSFSEEYLVVNAMVGKKIFKNQRGEINFGINDLFNQNRSYRRSFSDTYVQNTSNMVIGRYFGINFIYNLRNFGKRKASTQNSENSTREGFRMMPGGSPGQGSGGMEGGRGGAGGGMAF